MSTVYCIVVRRGDFQTYDLLYKMFGSRLPVIWDRREHEALHPDPDRRVRSAPASWVALGFVVAERIT
jgi:hypothetical protein